jgi:hypothetical protein
MNYIISILLFFSCGEASASSIEVFREPFQHLGTINAKFQVNQEHPESNRTWIEVTLEGSTHRTDSEEESVTWNKNIPGMTFDNQTGELLYTDGTNTPIVCAHLKTSKFLFVNSNQLTETGRCKLKSFISKESFQEKTNVREHDFAIVTMDIEKTNSTGSGEKMDPIRRPSCERGIADHHGP